MAIILGLDVSTSCTGFCVLDSDAPAGQHRELGWIDFKGCTTFWEKCDRARHRLHALAAQHSIARVVLEEPLMGFRPGMSSAQTITQLMRFNGIVSYLAREALGCEPEYVGSAHARKLCGIKLQRTALGGPQKEQVFAHMAANDLKHVTWPLTKAGKAVPWSRDACDAYVIARSAAVSGPIQPPVKKVRRKVA